jgi:hypothetical protein
MAIGEIGNRTKEDKKLREITDHIVEGDPAPQLKIEVTDELGSGGANHLYEISGFETYEGRNWIETPFQNGPIKESGVNGITQEALLAIVIDRLRSFQAGPFVCQENANALEYCKLALRELQIRTERRLARGVEEETKA